MTPKTPQNSPWDIEGRTVFSLCPFLDQSAVLYQIWCQSVQPFDSFPKHLNLWPTKTPRNAPGVLWDELYLAYVHFQTNLPMCTKFVPNLVPIDAADWQLPHTFECLTSKTPQNSPWDIEGRTVFSLCPFLDQSAVLYQIWCQSVQPFDSFPTLMNLWHPNPPRNAPWGIQGRLVFSVSQINLQTWTKVGANRTASQYFWIVDPLKPPKCLEGQFVWHISIPIWIWTCAKIWCQLAQPFGSFSRICAKLSSAFRRCTRWLAQKHAKKQHLYMENYNSGPNMQTATSLTFFTAIFVAFSGALAEELTIFCRDVRTDLYIDTLLVASLFYCL